jgi:hypothetical protein
MRVTSPTSGVTSSARTTAEAALWTNPRRRGPRGGTAASAEHSHHGEGHDHVQDDHAEGQDGCEPGATNEHQAVHPGGGQDRHDRKCDARDQRGRANIDGPVGCCELGPLR